MSIIKRQCFSDLRAMLRHVMLFCIFFPAATGRAQSPSAIEYKVKAVFLFNFTHFVEWPAAAFAHHDDPLVIGVLGSNGISHHLEEAVSGEIVNGHPLKVRYLKDTSGVKDCHMLFIQHSENEKVQQVLSSLKASHVLTISETSDFSEQGGMIRLFTEQNKVKLEINLEVVRASELQISSKLLRVARIYTPEKSGP